MTPLSRQRVAHEVKTLVAAGDRLVARGGETLLGFLASGRQAWRREIEGLAGIGLLHALDGAVFVEAAEEVLRLDARTGRTLARRRLGQRAYLNVESGFVTCHSGERFQALDPETLETWAACPDPRGRVRLEQGLFCEHTETALVLRDPGTGLELARLEAAERARHVHHRRSIAFFEAGGRRAVGLDAGQPLWSHPAAPGSDDGRYPLPSGRGLALVAGDGLSAYDLETGEQRWRALPGNTGLRPCWGILDGRLLLESGASVHAVDVATGEVVRSLDLGLSITAATLLAGGVVAVLGTTQQGENELQVLR